MRTLFQDDLFGGPPVVTVVPDPAPKLTTRRRRRLADTSVEAGRTRPKSASQRERESIHAEVKSNGAAGRTHHEIAERLGIELQSVCWGVGDLLTKKVVFYPEIGWDAVRCKPIYLKRMGRKVLVDAMYMATYPSPRPCSISDELARSA